MKAIEIYCRRWFQRIYGNTYHSVTIIVTNDDNTKSEMINPFSYGYGEQCLQTARGMLNEAGYLNESKNEDKRKPFWQILRDFEQSGIIVIKSIIDVNRRKDL